MDFGLNVDVEKKKFEQQRWIGCPTEQFYFGDERKAGKQKRKLASAKDRSKYKKTDREKALQAADVEAIQKSEQFVDPRYLRGRVLATTSEGFIVESQQGNFACTLRGILKKERGLAKNLVVVGDHVIFEATAAGEGLIAHVEARKTVLSRADNLSRRKEQLIAANIDQLIITGAVVTPILKPALLDRYVIAARKGGLEPLIVINKIDLLDDASFDEASRQKERELCEHLVDAYREVGIPAIAISVATGQGIEELKLAMQGKASVFSGQSGVGKSSLINVIAGVDLRTGEIIEKTSKGSHTTTSTRLVPLDFGGWCIDTPGIKSFGVWDLKKEEIEGYFAEIHACGRKCHFPNCTHFVEGGCAVIEAVENEQISIIRYQSYLSLLESVSQQHLRR